MATFEKSLLSSSATIHDAIEHIEASEGKISLVVDTDRRLLGTVTDGDIRRGILRGLNLDAPVTEVMKRSAITVKADMGTEQILALMREKSLRHIPVVDSSGRVIGLETLAELIQPVRKDNWVVIMAGGRGTRLRPLTEQVPKPMLKVGDRPLLEAIIAAFVEQGFRRFYISINYLAQSVKDYFGDGSRHSVEIQYLEEIEPLGTAGSLSLLPEPPDKPIFVINGDILTSVSFTDMLNFHEEHAAKATLAVRGYEFQIPFGVVDIDEYQITEIAEKPVKRYLVNAGIYVIDPELLSLVPKRDQFTMPELILRAQQKGYPTFAFPIREDWMDIGRFEDLVRANQVAES